jgi:hypothetical protein
MLSEAFIGILRELRKPVPRFFSYNHSCRIGNNSAERESKVEQLAAAKTEAML